MPRLTAQLVHYDYTRPNLLFESRRVVAVLDLKGHVAPPVWELGKIAFEPQTVVRSTDWLAVACAATGAYCAENPLAFATAPSCARAVVLYNMFSFWGPWQRYIEGIRAEQDDMDSYWLNRHTTARLLLVNLGRVEDRLLRASTS
jgi:homoserine kinase type II